ncbi:MAG: hypothetical protein ACJ789_03695 [Thermomicrobiales bacterium]
MALDVDLDRVWTRVAGEVWARKPSRLEQLAARLLRSPGLARALVTTPSLLISWVLATLAVLAVGVAATYASGQPLVALLAPALAGAGIAYAYGPGIDPAFELSRTMVVSDRTILLARALAVFGLNAILGILASLLTVEATDLTWLWLVPMTTIAALGLAGATLSGSANTGVATALASWGLIILARSIETRDVVAAAQPSVTLTPLYLMIAAIGVAVSLYATSGRRLEKPSLRSKML